MQVSDALRVAAAAGLPEGCLVRTGDPPVLRAEDVRAGVGNRIQGLVWRAIDTGAVVADDEVMAFALDAHLAALRTSLVAEETGVLALDALSGAGLEGRILKGIAIAHLDHVNPAERVFGDADVLVRPADLDGALDALRQRGFERAEPPVRRWWERRFAKSVVLAAPNGGELDLHLRIAAGYFGERIGIDRLWTRHESFTLAGRTVHTLAAPERLLQACAHSVLGGGSGLRGVRDVAQLSLLADADWSAVASEATGGGFDGVVAAAIESAWTTLQLDPRHPAAAWAAAHECPDPQLEAIGASRASGSGWTSEGLGALPAYGWIDRAKFLVGIAAPSSASLRARDRTRRQHVRRLLASSRSSSPKVSQGAGG